MHSTSRTRGVNNTISTISNLTANAALYTPNQEFVSSNDDEKAGRLLTCLDNAKKYTISDGGK